MFGNYHQGYLLERRNIWDVCPELLGLHCLIIQVQSYCSDCAFFTKHVSSRLEATQTLVDYGFSSQGDTKTRIKSTSSFQRIQSMARSKSLNPKHSHKVQQPCSLIPMNPFFNILSSCTLSLIHKPQNTFSIIENFRIKLMCYVHLNNEL